jgi:hypothetical protein
VSLPHLQEEVLPDLNIPARNINTFIKLSDPDALGNAHRNNNNLTLQLTNLSGVDIVFSDNFGVRVAAEDGETWKDIANNSPSSKGTIVLPTNKSLPAGLMVTVLPSIPDLSSSIEVRVVVIGHTVSRTGEEVAASIDVELDPESVLQPGNPLLAQFVR